MDVHSLSKSPKVVNSSKNASYLFKSDDCHSSNGVNQANVMLDNRMLMNPTWAGPSK